ncbi:MAG: phosphatase PAP2 family protein, partial [Fimbriimonadaceae bacterium]|nr:phosphatase PAP2 family protein [Alphaproteobacteria bacterium]
MRWLLGCFFLIDVVWIVSTDFTLDWQGTVSTLKIILVFVLLSLFFDKLFPKPILQSIVNSILFLLVLTNLGAIFGYLITSIAMPLQDTNFAAIDQAMGFDWRIWIDLIYGYPSTADTLTTVYHSSITQILFLVVILSVAKNFETLSRFTWSFAIALVVTFIISVAVPAVSADAFFAPPDDMNLYLRATNNVYRNEVFLGLRDGSLRTIDTSRLEGLVSFPSF